MNTYDLESITLYTYSDEYGSRAIITSSEGDLVSIEDYKKLLEAYNELKFRMDGLDK